MRKTNSKKITTIVAAALMIASLGMMTGCSATTTVTKTETTTYTDADGHTVTETKETVNGQETSSVQYENIPMAIENDLGGDIAELYLKMTDTDDWSDNFLGEDYFIDDNTTANGINVSYTSNANHIDVSVYDVDGNNLEFDGVELPANNGEEMTLILEYDAEAGDYCAYVI